MRITGVNHLTFAVADLQQFLSFYEEGQSVYFTDPDGHLLELHTGNLD